MTKRQLTADEDRVLLYLYEHKDEGEANSLSKIMAGTGLSESTAKAALRTLKEGNYIGGGQDLLAECMEALKKLDPNFEPTASGYAEHIVLIASALFKADESILAQELGYDPEFVGIIGARLRSAGIWIGNDLSLGRLDAWDELSFFLDGAVACGDLMVVSKIGDEPEYQMTSSGKTKVENILKK